MAKKQRNPLQGTFDVADVIDEILGRLFDHATERITEGPYDGPEPTRCSPLRPEESELYAEIVELGFREAIKRYHPDRDGGSAEKAAAINALRDKVRRLAGVKK